MDRIITTIGAITQFSLNANLDVPNRVELKLQLSKNPF